MPPIEDYASNPQRVLIDAAADPSFKPYIEPGDLESITVDTGDGRQAQVQALRRSSVRRVIERILAKGRETGTDLKKWICSPDEFDLCSKLDTPVGELLREVDAFLKNKAAQGGTVVLGLVAIFTNPALGAAPFNFRRPRFCEQCFCRTLRVPRTPQEKVAPGATLRSIGLTTHRGAELTDTTRRGNFR